MGANITIPRLNGGGNYDLGAAGVLPVFWIDGANVTDGGLGGAIVPYGTLKITAGSLTCVNGQGAIVLRESGLLQIDGGVSLETIAEAASAGANCFVAGSAVYKSSDPAGMVEQLREKAQTNFSG